ncbi:hypothetical protein BDW22DRAFT_1483505 [Trametopsis cervina]|nr:hypothetical protein BDW22DRAFT_1483505 [Trametopsis cervina]
MSVLQRLRALPLGDLLHRTFLYSLVGISGWGVFMMGAVHRDTLKRGRDYIALAAREAEAGSVEDRERAEREVALAEAASNSLASNSKKI